MINNSASTRRVGLFFSLFLGWTLLSISLNALSKDYLIRNATVHTAGEKGTLLNTDVYISDGFIMAVGPKLKSRPSYQVIDAKGKHITPGLMNAWTQVGLEELSSVAASVDHHTNYAKHGAGFDVSLAVNLNSTLIPHNRMHGLTRAIIAPTNGTSILQGAGAAILLQAGTEEYIQPAVAQFIQFGADGAKLSGGSRASAFLLLQQALDEADFLRNNRRQFTPGKPHQFNFSIADLDALAPVLERKIPLVVSANRRSDILNLIKLSKAYKIKLVLNGGAEAWMLARELALAEIPVLIDPMDNIPGQFESLGIKLEAALLLDRAGVKLLFTNRSSHNAYLVRQSAGKAVSYGLAPQAAVKAMTVNIAETFGVENYGKIELGMQADVVVWDGDPLEVTSHADYVFIKGVEQPLVSRATRLRDRYWQLPTPASESTKKGLIKKDP